MINYASFPVRKAAWWTKNLQQN